MFAEGGGVGQAAKRVFLQAPRKGTADVFEGMAGLAEQPEPEGARKSLSGLSATEIQEIGDRAYELNPEDPAAAFEQARTEVINRKKKDIAARWRRAAGKVDTEVDITPGFKGGALGKIEEAAVGFAEFAPAMVTTAINAPAGVAVTYAQLFGEKYKSTLEETKDQETAYVTATLHAALGTPAEMAGNILQIKALTQIAKNLGMKKLKAGAVKTLVENIGNTIRSGAAEAGEEGIQAYTEAFAEVYGKAPEGATPEQIQATYTQVISSDQFKEGLRKSVELGGIGGMLLPGVGTAIRTQVDLANLAATAWKKTPDQKFLVANPLATQEDIDAARADTGDGDVDAAESEIGLKEETPAQLSTETSTFEKKQQERKVATETEEKEAQAEINRQRQEMIEAEESERIMEQERQAIAAEQEREIARSQQRVGYVQSLSDPAVLMDQADQLDAKPINEAHKALTIGEDNVKKLKGIEYDLKHSKELKEQPFEYQAVADGLAEHVQQRISDVEQAEAQKEFNELTKKGAEIEVKEREEVIKEVAQEETVAQTDNKPKKATTESDVFEIFAEDTVAVVKEREAEEKAKKKAEKKPDKQVELKKMFDRRSYARRKAMGISDRTSAKLDQTFAEQRRKAAEKAKVSTTVEKPKDLKAAIQLESGEVLTGPSHVSILGELSDEQLEQVITGNVKRGFNTSTDGFMTVEESVSKYGVAKSQQLDDTLYNKRVDILAQKNIMPEQKAVLQYRGLKGRGGKGVTKQQVQERFAQMPKKLKGYNVEVVESVADLKPHVAKGIGSAKAAYAEGASAKAGSGTIFVVADRHQNMLDVMISTWHEMGHSSLKKLAEAAGAGKDVTVFLDEVKKKYKTHVATMRSLAPNMTEDQAAEEVLIQQFEVGHDQQLRKRVLRLLRKVAAKLGFGEITDEDQLAGLIYNMRRTATGKPVRFGQKNCTKSR
jgi:hypothetical protein